MTVFELKQQLEQYPDNAEVVLSCEDINGATIIQDLTVQSNDGDENSPVYLEFALTEEVVAHNINK